MDLTPYQLTETVTVNAAPERVYDLIADIARMGEWSSVCTGCEWDDDAHTNFTGTNTIGDRTWQTKCRVDAAERGKEFTFVNCGLDGETELVRWSYTFAPTAGGTEVSESWQILPDYAAFRKRITPDADLTVVLDESRVTTRQSIIETLGRLKAVAEG